MAARAGVDARQSVTLWQVARVVAALFVVVLDAEVGQLGEVDAQLTAVVVDVLAHLIPAFCTKKKGGGRR